MDPEPEVLERRGHEPWPRRRLAVGLLVASTLLAAAVSADRAARTQEAADLDRCERAANAALGRAWAPVGAMAAYVRPTLSQVSAGSTRDGLLQLVADQATGRTATLHEAADRCRGVRLWWHHSDLRSRRSSCANALAAEASRLEDVADDGRAAFVGNGRSRCG